MVAMGRKRSLEDDEYRDYYSNQQHADDGYDVNVRLRLPWKERDQKLH